MSAYCLLSVTFSSFSFLDTGKAKCSHTSKTCCFTNFGPRFAFVTCTIRYFPFATIFVQANRAQTMSGTHGPMVTVGPASFLTAAEKTTFFVRKTHHCKPTTTLMTPWNWWYRYIPTQYTSCFCFFFSLYHKVQYHWLILPCTLDCEHKWHFIFVSPYQEENSAASEIRSCFIWC